MVKGPLTRGLRRHFKQCQSPFDVWPSPKHEPRVFSKRAGCSLLVKPAFCLSNTIQTRITAQGMPFLTPRHGLQPDVLSRALAFLLSPRRGLRRPSRFSRGQENDSDAGGVVHPRFFSLRSSSSKFRLCSPELLRSDVILLLAGSFTSSSVVTPNSIVFFPFSDKIVRHAASTVTGVAVTFPTSCRGPTCSNRAQTHGSPAGPARRLA